MSTPVEEFADPFGDPPMSVSPKHTPRSSDAVTSAESGTSTNTGEKTKGKKRVGFRGGVEADALQPSILVESSDGTQSPLGTILDFESPEISGSNTPSFGHTRQSSADVLFPFDTDRSHLPELSRQQTEQLRGAISRGLDVPRPRPAMRPVTRDVEAVEEFDNDEPRARSAREAHERAKRHEQQEQLIHSTPASRQSSPTRQSRNASIELEDIPLQDLSEARDYEGIHERQRKASQVEAFNLVRRHTAARDVYHTKPDPDDHSPGLQSGAVTPIEEQLFAEDYQPQPQQYRGGILGSLLKLYGDSSHGSGRSSIPKAHTRPHSGDYSGYSTPATSPPSSGATTPTGKRHWYSHKHHAASSSSLATLIGSSSSIGSPAVAGLGEQVSQKLREHQEQQAKRPSLGRRTRSGALDAVKRISRPRGHDEFRITAHIAETISRQKYLLKLCKALMQYGAPTHRLEEYMTMSARVLETEAQFLYIPGAMIVSFEDRVTHTSEVKLVKVAQGLDLGKLRDVHEIYKEVASTSYMPLSVLHVLTCESTDPRSIGCRRGSRQTQRRLISQT